MGIILNLPAEVIDLHIVQPRIQALQCGFQARYDNDLREGFPEALLRIVLFAVIQLDDSPSQLF